MRPSGTLQSPTTGSLEAMLLETAREDQIAAARRVPKDVNIQLPDAPAATYEPAPAQTSDGTKATPAATAQTTNTDTKNGSNPSTVASNASTNDTSSAKNAQADSTVPQPKAASVSPPAESNSAKSIDVATAIKNVVNPNTDVSTTAANAKENVNVTTPAEDLAPKSAVSEPPVKPIEPLPTVIELRLSPDKNEMTVGEKRQLTVELNSEAPLGLVVVMLRFDPNIIKVQSVTIGKLFADAKTAPTITQSTSDKGVLLVSLAPAAGFSISGQGALLNVEVEAIGAGDGSLAFDVSNVHLVSSDGRNTVLQLAPMSLTVKPQAAAKSNN
jgi:hypothetical protein